MKMPTKITTGYLAAQKRIGLLCTFILLVCLPFLKAQYSFLAVQYPEYQTLINPAVTPFENLFSEDQFIAGFHQRWSNERWAPELDNNQQRLAYANLKLNDFKFKSLRGYSPINMSGHLHFYEENNGAASLSAIYSGGMIQFSALRWYKNQLIIGLGFNVGIIQHRIDYSAGIDNIPLAIRDANFSSMSLIDAGGGLKIQYRSKRYGITGLFSTPANYGVNATYHDDSKTDFAFAGIQQYHAGVHLQYFNRRQKNLKSYIQFTFQTAWDQAGDLLSPNLSVEYGLNNLFPTILYGPSNQTAAISIGYSPNRESQIYHGNSLDTPNAFAGINTSLPIYQLSKKQLINIKLSYKFITDVADFSGQSAHAIGLAFSLNRLLKYNPNPHWRAPGAF